MGDKLTLPDDLNVLPDLHDLMRGAETVEDFAALGLYTISPEELARAGFTTQTLNLATKDEDLCLIVRNADGAELLRISRTTSIAELALMAYAINAELSRRLS